MATGVTDFVSVMVESLSVFVLAAGLVITQHADAVLHSENLVIDSAVVSVLISQVIEALSKLSDKLVLF